MSGRRAYSFSNVARTRLASFCVQSLDFRRAPLTGKYAAGGLLAPRHTPGDLQTRSTTTGCQDPFMLRMTKLRSFPDIAEQQMRDCSSLAGIRPSCSARTLSLRVTVIDRQHRRSKPSPIPIVVLERGIRTRNGSRRSRAESHDALVHSFFFPRAAASFQAAWWCSLSLAPRG